VVQEAYVHGISTRAVDNLVKALGAGGMSKCPSGNMLSLLNRL
jgi:transposase-like protein